MPLNSEINVRLTDVIGDKSFERLGNVGNELLAILLDKFHQALGMPFEVLPFNPATLQLTVSSGVYQLPDQRRIAPMRNGEIPMISNAVIDFAAGTIDQGTLPTFDLPTMTALYYVKALIQFSYAKNGFKVSFGTEGLTLSAAGAPKMYADYEPIALVELYSVAGGVGVFEPITKQALVLVWDSLAYSYDPEEERFVVVGSPQSIFNLTTINIPTSRSKMMVFVNGVYQILDIHYTITSDTQVQFNEPVSVNAEIIFRII